MANNNNDGGGDIRPVVAREIESISSNNTTRFFLRCLADIHGGPLNETEMVAIAEAISNSTQVQELCLQGALANAPAPATSRFLDKILETHPSLREIDLSHSNLNSQLTDVIGRALKINTSLKVFWLYNNEIGAHGAEALAEVLHHNSMIQTFNLSRNGIGPRGAEVLAGVLHHNNAIQAIDLSNNDIGTVGAEALAEALRINNALQTIDLSDNNIGPQGAEALAGALCINKTLETIRLWNTGTGPRGAVALAEVFGHRSPEEQLRHNNTLREIDLGNNGVGDETAVAIADELCTNSSLVTIHLDQNSRITNVGARAIEDTLAHLNYAVESVPIFITDVSHDLRGRICHLCEQNRRVKAFFRKVNQNIPTIPLGVWPTVLEAVECKPDLLFALLKTKAEVFREVQHNGRRRRRPDWLRY